MRIEELLKGESKNVEFKVNRPKDYNKYVKTVIAFANSTGGTIIFGVEDKMRKVVGIPDDIVFSEMDAITNTIMDSCAPAIIPDIYLKTIEEKTLIIVEVPIGSARPYYIKSLGVDAGTYIRVSGTTRLADDYMKIIEHWGSGILRVIKEVEDGGLRKPVFSDGEIDVVVRIYRENKASEEGSEETLDGSKNENKELKGAKKELKGAERSQTVLHELEQNPMISQIQLAEKLGLSRKQVQTSLKLLQEEGKVIRDGARNGGKWIVL